ncbi:hypothetical protein BUALT_Bualt16G0054600 [Buddleja alternifolia]|uniref:Uncharacterized protein n=1 Tax=Buddleja alternifolia TaxID=168488 RepID=A0AAV6W9Y8_9LAMI|nr:hypothetical protein BUALT_Bualt16G0054600 [Buddleja alternifolia]
MTLPTVGYGDLHAENTSEMIFTIVNMFFNLGPVACRTGHVTNLVVYEASKTRKFVKRYRSSCLMFCKKESIASLPSRTYSFTFVLEVPDKLGVDKVYLFKGVSNDLLNQLHLKELKDPIMKGVLLETGEMLAEERMDIPLTPCFAALKGDKVLFGRLLDRGLDPNASDSKRTTALHQKDTNEGSVPLWEAMCVEPHNLKLLEEVVKCGANVTRPKNKNGTPLDKHLKELKDLIMKGVLLETGKLLAEERMDIPLTPCFAALKGDNVLFGRLLNRGLDPNASDSKTTMALLLLYHEVDPNRRASEGSVPLWEAMCGLNEQVVKLLVEIDAKLTTDDVGQFACNAVEPHNLKLLEEVVKCGANITRPKNKNDTPCSCW